MKKILSIILVLVLLLTPTFTALADDNAAFGTDDINLVRLHFFGHTENYAPHHVTTIYFSRGLHLGSQWLMIEQAFDLWAASGGLPLPDQPAFWSFESDCGHGVYWSWEGRPMLDHQFLVDLIPPEALIGRTAIDFFVTHGRP